MNFYRRRPLAMIITVSILISAAAYFLSGTGKIVLLALLVLTAPFVLALFDRFGMNTLCGLAKVPFVVICSALSVCMVITSYAYYNVHAQKYEGVADASVNATVLTVESRTAYDAVYGVKIITCEGEQSKGKILLQTQSDLSLNVGDVIKADITFYPTEEFYSYREYTRGELLASGYIATAKMSDTAVIMGSSGSISVWINKLRSVLQAKISLYLDSDSALLTNALFLGFRGDLGVLWRDFAYSGVVHLLAFSGLHLSIIGGGFERLLMRLGVGVRIRYIMTVLLTVFYVALAGLPASAVRAAIMLMLSYAAVFLDRDNDRVTSLFVAVGFIALADPTAVFDVGLQLSFFGTLGLLLVTEPAERLSRKIGRKSKALKFLSKLFVSVAASVGAVMFVLPLQWLYFGKVSLMSVAATLIMSPICEAILTFAPFLLISALLGWGGVCGVIGGVVRILCDMCAAAASALCEQATMVSLLYPFTLPILALCVAVIVYMMIRNYSSWLYALIPFGVASAVFLTGVHISGRITLDRVTLDIHGGDGSDMIAVVSRNRGMVIDVGNGSSECIYSTERTLESRNITEVEAFMLTHVNRRHVSTVRRFLNYIKTDTLLIPNPSNEQDMYIAADLAEVASAYGTRVAFYDRSGGTEISHGDMDILVSPEAKLSRSVYPLTAMKFLCDWAEVAYVGASVWEDEEAWELVNGTKYMLLGSNGPEIKASPPGTVGDTTALVYITSDGTAKEILPWLDSFDGTLIVKESLSAVFEP